MYGSALNDDESFNFDEAIDPFSDWERSKHRNELLKWVKSLNIFDKNSNKNEKIIKEQKVIEIITTMQQHGLCSISDLIHVNNEKVKLNAASLHTYPYESK